MKIPIFMIFQFFGVISAWASKALADGKVSAQEGLELIVALTAILGVAPEFSIEDFMDTPKETTIKKVPIPPDPDQPPGRIIPNPQP